MSSLILPRAVTSVNLAGKDDVELVLGEAPPAFEVDLARLRVDDVVDSDASAASLVGVASILVRH